MPAEGEGKYSKPAANHSMMTAIALYDKAGDLIYMGQSKGTITVLDSVSLKFLDVVKVCIYTTQHHIQGIPHTQPVTSSWTEYHGCCVQWQILQILLCAIRSKLSRAGMHEMSVQAQTRQLAIHLQQHEVTCWAGGMQPSQMVVAVNQ